MKKISAYAAAAALALGMAAPLQASAATLSLAPASGSHTVGTTYSVAVYADPQGAKAYTAKVEIDFPAQILQVDGFTAAAGTIPLVQPGYDLTDNTAGKLIKTVGFSGGITASTLVGTITFSAAGPGVADVLISSSNSELLDASNQNLATAYGTAVYSLSAPVRVQPAAAPAAQKPAPATANSSAVSATSTAVSTTSASIQNAAAAVAAASSTGISSGSHSGIWITILVVLILIALGIWLMLKKGSKKGKKKLNRKV